MTENNEKNYDDITDYSGASRITHIKRSTLMWMVHEKKIPHIRLGPRMVRFRVSVSFRPACVAEKKNDYFQKFC